MGYGTVATLSGCAKLNFWAFDAVLHWALPVGWALVREALPRGRRGWWTRLYLHRPAGANRMEGGARRRRHPDAIRVILQTAFDPISRGEERVEALDQVGMTGEKFGDATNNTRCVDTATSQLLATVSKGRGGTATHVWLLKSFMMSRNLLYTSGCSEN